MTVDLRGVDEGDAEVERPVDGADRLSVVGAGAGVGGGHAHGAEPDAGRRRGGGASRVSCLNPSVSMRGGDPTLMPARLTVRRSDPCLTAAIESERGVRRGPSSDRLGPRQPITLKLLERYVTTARALG